MNYAASLRRLLRCVHQPKVLERDPFGLALKRALGVASVHQALQQCIDTAFSQDTEAWSAHRRLLWCFDLERHVPRYRAAAELGISTRRFYYLQAEAVEELARYTETLVQSSAGVSTMNEIVLLLAQSDPARAAALIASLPAALYAHVVSTPYHCELPQKFQTYKAADAGLAGAIYALHDELRGERDSALLRLQDAVGARLDYIGHASRMTDLALAMVRGVIARHDGSSERLSAAAHDARAAASEVPRGFERWDVLLAAESALARGDGERVDEILDAALPAATREGAYRFALQLAVLKNEALFLSGEFEEALHGADLLCACAGSNADVLSAAAALGLRARIACGKPGEYGYAEPHSLWHTLYADALRARADAFAGMSEEAAARAQSVRRAAAWLGYAGVEAHAAGTVAFAQNDVTAALDAWGAWLAGRHAAQGFDAVSGIPVRALLLHRAALEAVHRLAVHDHPEWALLRLLQEGHDIARFWNAVLAAVLDGSPLEELCPLVDELCAASRAAQIGEDSRAFANLKDFTSAVALLVPFEDRAHFQHALTAVLQHCSGRANRGIRRQRARTAIQSA